MPGIEGRPRALGVWWLAIRPRTLSLSLTPVILGAGLGWLQAGRFDPLVFSLTLTTALLLQIGANLHNDAADFRRGADGPERLGPARVVARGWLDAGTVHRAALICFGLAVLSGLYLVWRGGWPLLMAGLLAVAVGIAYTGGPRPLAYRALGEICVFLFFGWVAVAGSFYLQVATVSAMALAQGTALGALAAAVLLVNNYRDMDQDRQTGKCTLAVLLGRPPSRRLYGALVLAPFAVAAWERLYLPLLLLPAALWATATLWRRPPGAWLNGLLARTAQLQLGYAVLVLADIYWRQPLL